MSTIHSLWRFINDTLSLVEGSSCRRSLAVAQNSGVLPTSGKQPYCIVTFAGIPHYSMILYTMYHNVTERDSCLVDKGDSAILFLGGPKNNQLINTIHKTLRLAQTHVLA